MDTKTNNALSGNQILQTYSIIGWDEYYENSRSRVIKNAAWVPIPNKHDGEGYLTVMADPRATEIFTAWILILQVASKCHERGLLVKSDGTPHTPRSLATKTHGKVEWFELAFEVLSQPHIGWIKCQSTDSRIPVACQEGDGQVTGNCRDTGNERTEGKGTELNGTEGNVPDGKVKAKRFVKPTPEEVHKYMIARNWKVPNGNKFWNTYETKGWIAGKTPMKDWKAAVHTWEDQPWFDGFNPSKEELQPIAGIHYDVAIIDGQEVKYNPGTTDPWDGSF